MTHLYETLAVTTDDRGIVSLDLNRPDKRNAISAQMIAELADFAARFPTDGRIRAVVLSGRGDVFCAGGDLAWMKEQINADRPQRMREARKLAMMLKALNEIPAPVIARVHAGAFGGGVGLCSICDVVIAERDAKFGLTETRLGLIPATISPYVVARIGDANARRVCMSGALFSAEMAQSLGLVSTVVAKDDLDAAISAEIDPYLKTAPMAAAAAKALVRSLGPRIDDAVIDDTIRQLADIWEGEEANHGISAFLTKTKPRWA